MSEFEEKWTMHGRVWDDPERVKSPDELIAYIDRVGFLPLFRCDVAGCSVEEQVSDLYWWSDDTAQDPWYWRTVLARSGRVGYGKLYGGKMGFVSLKWLPKLANLRREGYDFVSSAEEGRAGIREIKLMDLFEGTEALPSYEMKQRSGIKSFEGTLQRLQHGTYLLIRDFIQKVNKQGVPYGWNIAVYSPPERIWGEAMVRSAYSESPEKSAEDILEFLKGLYPGAGAEQLKRLIF